MYYYGVGQLSSELLVPRLQSTLHGQAFVLQGNGLLNFSFSPRSALLMLIFGLSIRRQQGLPDFVRTAMITTLGMRLSWRRWNELLQNANVWNRRYVDFFVAMAGTLTVASAGCGDFAIDASHRDFAIDASHRTLCRC